MTSNAPQTTSKSKIRIAVVIVLVLVGVALCLYRNPFESQHTRDQREFAALIETRLVRGRELLKIAPQVKTEAWKEWYFKLPDGDQEAYSLAL